MFFGPFRSCVASGKYPKGDGEDVRWVLFAATRMLRRENFREKFSTSRRNGQKGGHQGWPTMQSPASETNPAKGAKASVCFLLVILTNLKTFCTSKKALHNDRRVGQSNNHHTVCVL